MAYRKAKQHYRLKNPSLHFLKEAKLPVCGSAQVTTFYQQQPPLRPSIVVSSECCLTSKLMTARVSSVLGKPVPIYHSNKPLNRRGKGFLSVGLQTMNLLFKLYYENDDTRPPYHCRCYSNAIYIDTGITYSTKGKWREVNDKLQWSF